jgi:spermidine/putrescine transport system ATP-binding protein
MSDQVAVMNQGVFEQIDTPQHLYHRPRTPFVARFVGDNNTWAGTVRHWDDQALEIETGDGFSFRTVSQNPLPIGTAVDLFLRPEAMLIQPDAAIADLNRFKVVVKSILFDGANSRLLVHPLQTDTELLVALPQNRQYDDIRQEDHIEIGWAPSSGICFAQRAP